MAAFGTLLIVAVAVVAASIALYMLDDVFARRDRRRRVHEVFDALNTARTNS